MRRYDEAIQVRSEPPGTPTQFRWRGRVWSVREVVTRWLETGAWWDSPLVKAVRGDDQQQLLDDRDIDLLAEHEVWRVVAGTGATVGVYELDHVQQTGSWRLRAVAD